MVLKTVIFVVTNCLCIYSCYSAPPFHQQTSLADFVLDGRNDCALTNNDKNVNELFKINTCPSEGKKFTTNYFDQRDFLPCFGAYDALYNLCAFSHESINFTTPESFKDPSKFCNEAKVVYAHLPLNSTNSNVKPWRDALLSTMKNETLCKNLCVMNIMINYQCIAMLTFASQYVHLKESIVSNTNLPKLAVNTNLNEQPVVAKAAPIVNIASDLQVKNNNSDLKTMIPITSINQNSVNVTLPNKAADVQPETENVNLNSKGESKPFNPSDTKLSPVVEPHFVEGNLPETETNNKDIKASVNDKNVITSPETSTTISPKSSPTVIDEGMNDDNEKGMTDEDIRGENDEAAPVEPKGKGDADEENEKPNEEEKNTVPETEQHAAYHGGLSPMIDSFSESEDSYSFTYIVTTMAALCCVYLLFHYRNKLLALALEGRKGRSSRSRGRPSSANYSKLHSNLEEAIASNITAPSATHVLY